MTMFIQNTRSLFHTFIFFNFFKFFKYWHYNLIKRLIWKEHFLLMLVEKKTRNMNDTSKGARNILRVSN